MRSSLVFQNLLKLTRFRNLTSYLASKAFIISSLGPIYGFRSSFAIETQISQDSKRGRIAFIPFMSLTYLLTYSTLLIQFGLK